MGYRLVEKLPLEEKGEKVRRGEIIEKEEGVLLFMYCSASGENQKRETNSVWFDYLCPIRWRKKMGIPPVFTLEELRGRRSSANI